jgi:hypothetical protein
MEVGRLGGWCRCLKDASFMTSLPTGLKLWTGGAATALGLALTLTGAAPARADQRYDNRVAVFSALDKVTATIKTLEVAIGETVQFGALKVTPRVCYSRPPTELPKTTSFVEVDEIQLDGKEKRIFTGWMFAQSPGLNAVEHPVFDVWLTDCQKPRNSIAQQPPGAAPVEGWAAEPEPEYSGEENPAEMQRRRVRR